MDLTFTDRAFKHQNREELLHCVDRFMNGDFFDTDSKGKLLAFGRKYETDNRYKNTAIGAYSLASGKTCYIVYDAYFQKMLGRPSVIIAMAEDVDLSAIDPLGKLILEVMNSEKPTGNLN